MSAAIQLTGQRYGKLTVSERAANYVSPGGFQYSMWKCDCECGGTITTRADALRNGRVISCGCVLREKAGARFRTHGLTRHADYYLWKGMFQRCNNPRNRDYANYGGRGIKVCERWKSFPNFIADMGIRDDKSLSIDRIDCDGDYEPSNCRWATPIQQARNKANTKLVTAFGETLPLGEWAERMGISRSAIYERIERGWTTERALLAPLSKRGGVRIARLRK